MSGIRKMLSIIVLMLVGCTALAQQLKVEGRVLDNATGETLPYVKVEVAGGGRATITNHEGDFAIMADPTDVLCFSFVGYEKRFVKAADMPKSIRLKPWQGVMGEVTVTAWEKVLQQASQKLDKEHRKHGKKTSQYFFRMNTAYRYYDVTEAFVKARSMGSLRNTVVVSGRHARRTAEGEEGAVTKRMNFHHMLEASPWIAESEFWQNLVTPLMPNITPKFLQEHYDITAQTLQDSVGTKYFCFDIKRKDEGGVKKVYGNGIMTGRLYMDATTLQPLRFEGKIEDMAIVVTDQTRREKAALDIDVHMVYDNTKGYTEVQNMATKMHSGDMTSQCVMFNVDDIDLASATQDADGKKKDKKQETVKENMLTSIKEAGFDELLWQNSDIVKRTNDEAKAMKAGEGDMEETRGGAMMAVPLTASERKVVGELPDDADPRLARLISRVLLFGQSFPQEKVYVHMDNTCYFVGDTIWYAAYLRNTFDDEPSNKSGTLYVELYNQDGYLVERQLVQMRGGRGYGNFALNDDQYAGYYELRAYTRWQLNWGRFERKNASVSKDWFISEEMHDNYFRDYDKLYSRVFPVYDKPKTEGEYIEDMTLRPMRRYFKKEPHKRQFALNLYPEGGNVVAGLPCRVAYEAVWEDGQEMELQGRPSRGTIEVTPVQGEKYKVSFTDKEGRKVEASLPKPEREGVALRASQTDKEWRFDLQLSPGLSKDSIAVTIMQEGTLQKIFAVKGSTDILRVEKVQMREGVNQITVFDVNGRILADRLFFNMLPDDRIDTLVNTAKSEKRSSLTGNIQLEKKKLFHPIDVKPTGERHDGQSIDEATYDAYESIELSLNTVPYSVLSISIRDAANSDLLNDNATMYSEMLLSSEIKGFVANPQYYFERDDEEHRQALDLLLMIQGWRRFDWREMAVPGEFELTEPAEQTPILNGRVYKNPELELPEYSAEEFVAVASTAGMHFTDTDKGADELAILERHPELNYVTSTASVRSGMSSDETGSAQNTHIRKTTDENHNNVPRTASEEMDRYRQRKKRNKEVLTHMELVSLDGKDVIARERMTEDGAFSYQMPGFYGNAILFFCASDSGKWSKRDRLKPENHIWVQNIVPEEDLPDKKRNRYVVDPADYVARIFTPYPRFVKPYHYYQTEPLVLGDSLLQAIRMQDGTTQMKELKVGAKRGGMKRFSDSIPAMMIDAYDAYNYALDAGMLTAYPENIVRAYVGDYGLEFPYTSPSGSIQSSNIQVRFGYDEIHRATHDKTLDEDSMYMHRNLWSFAPYDKQGRLTAFMTPLAVKEYYEMQKLDKYVIYTDYQPRLAGDSRYYGSLLPETSIAIYKMPEGARRMFYRDRRYVHAGYNYADDFYSPSYKNRKLDDHPKDYRRTLYWNPEMRLGREGKARIRIFNNGKSGQIRVSAEGMTADGVILGN